MTELDEREAFLRSIFDAPGDDTPRLVYADWLEERHWPDHAGLIRIQCELAKRQAGETPTPEQYRRQAQYIRAVNAHDRPPITSAFPHRGFRVADKIVLPAEELDEPESLRARAATRNPEWFGATAFSLESNRITSHRQIESILELACFQNVVELDLSGRLVLLPGQSIQNVPNLEYRCEPALNGLALESLANHRGLRRMLRITLHNNNFDNDALRVLMRSTNLIRIREIGISRGNTFRGRVWGEFQSHFGEEIVS